jgi:hypothetical protein
MVGGTGPSYDGGMVTDHAGAAEWDSSRGQVATGTATDPHRLPSQRRRALWRDDELESHSHRRMILIGVPRRR